MNTKYLYLILASAFVLAGCSARLEDDMVPEPRLFTGVIEQGEGTRTALGDLTEGTFPVNWSSDDQVMINNVLYKVNQIVDGNRATFGPVNANEQLGENDYYYAPQWLYCAWYPASLNVTRSAYQLKITLPETQYYKEGRIDHLPMVGRSDTDMFLHFKNICAVLRVVLTGSSDVKVSRIVVTNPNYNSSSYNSALSGTYVVGSSYDNPTNWQWWNTRYMDKGGSSSVTLDCLQNTSGEGVPLSDVPKSFYIALPAITGSGTYKPDVYVYRVGSDTPIHVFNAKTSIKPVRNRIYSVMNGD